MNGSKTNESYRKMALWGLVAILALLLLASAGGSVGANEYGDMGVGEPPHTQQVRTISYNYDGAGRLTSANYGQGDVLVYNYDRGGNLLSVSDHYGIYLPLVVRRF